MIILRLSSQADSKQGVNFEHIPPRTQKMIPIVKVSLIYFPYFSAMDTTNVQIKKQVFELLSALCVYSAEGYKRALEALEHYKTFRSERYRFKLIVDEVREAKSTEYQTVLLAFVNCLIISTPQLKVRNSILDSGPLRLYRVSQ